MKQTPPVTRRRDALAPARLSRRAPRLLLATLFTLTSALTAAIAVAPTATLAQDPPRPPYYAIKDAKVVTVSGATLERATVLLADGLIEAVGPDLPIPDDAWVIEGAGLTVYPGLIDGLGTLGQKQIDSNGDASRSGGAGGAQPGPTIDGPEDRPQTTPWLNAADNLSDRGSFSPDSSSSSDPKETDPLEKWRKAGFTSAVTSPEDGFFPGQPAILSLAGDDANAMVLATPVAQRISFTRSRGGGRGYPGSLMGILSYIGQVFSDARHYQNSLGLYEASPRGKQRPEYDRTLQPLVDALSENQSAKLPFLLPGDSPVEIDRALTMAERYQLGATVIYGAQGAYARADQLEKKGASVLVNVEWPEEEKGRDPEADTPFRQLYHRRTAPSTPSRLAAAGVPFAFYAEGASSPSDLLEGVKKAVDDGLTEEAALRALTLGPASIFGVGDRLGSIEAGKIAHVIVATAAPWVDDAEVKAVFIDGHYFDYAAEEEPSEAPTVDVTGEWKLTMKSPRGERESTAQLEMAEDGKVKGELGSERGTTKIEEGRVSGSTLTFATTQTMGPRTVEASFTLEVEGEKLAGSMSAGPMSIEIEGERTEESGTQIAEAGAEEGDGGAEASSDETEQVTQQELDEALHLYEGPAGEITATDFAITNVTVWTNSNQTNGGDPIPGATVVVKDGKIDAVGQSVRVPRNLEVIDGQGGHLIPGIIDAHSHIAIDGGVNEGTLAVTSMVGIEDVIDPNDIGIYRALAGGVTTANLLHGSANPIGGKNAVIKLRWGQSADELVFEGAMPGIKFALGENPKRSRGGGPARYPATRMGVMDVIREAFLEAQEYRKHWQRYEAAIRAGKEPIPPLRDFELEALVEILEGKRFVHAHCYRADEILQLLRLADEFGFKIRTLQHVLEGYKVADEIAAHGAGASTFSDWWGYKVEAYDAIPYNAALMVERGVLVSINSDSGEEMRHLNQEAAKTIKWGGLSETEALKLVTLNPAKQLGIDARVGSIEKGKDADLVLYNGNPLSVMSVVQKTFVDGVLYFDREHDRARQEKIDAMKARLLGKAPKADDVEPVPSAATPATPATPDPDSRAETGHNPEAAEPGAERAQRDPEGRWAAGQRSWTSAHQLVSAGQDTAIYHTVAPWDPDPNPVANNPTLTGHNPEAAELVSAGQDAAIYRTVAPWDPDPNPVANNPTLTGHNPEAAELVSAGQDAAIYRTVAPWDPDPNPVANNPTLTGHNPEAAELVSAGDSVSNDLEVAR